MGYGVGSDDFMRHFGDQRDLKMAQKPYGDLQKARPSRDGLAIYVLFPKMNRAVQW